VRQFWSGVSLHTQLVCFAVGCIAVTAFIAVAVVCLDTWGPATLTAHASQLLQLRLIAALALSGAMSLALIYMAASRLLRPLQPPPRCHVAHERRAASIPPSPSSNPPAPAIRWASLPSSMRILQQVQRIKNANEESKTTSPAEPAPSIACLSSPRTSRVPATPTRSSPPSPISSAPNLD